MLAIVYCILYHIYMWCSEALSDNLCTLVLSFVMHPCLLYRYPPTLQLGGGVGGREEGRERERERESERVRE